VPILKGGHLKTDQGAKGVMQLISIEQIEEHIDTESLSDLLDLIGEVCSLKSDHVNYSWQDSRLAKKWSRISYRLITFKTGGL